MTVPFINRLSASPRLAELRDETRQQRAAATPAGPTAVPKMQKTTITRGEADYLRSQARNILLNGGSEEDVAKFLELEQHRMPPRIQPEPEIPGITRGLAMNAVQGITFGFGDEALGALLGILTGEGARGGIETYRRELELFAKEHPGVSLPTQVVGGLLTGVGIARGAASVGKAAAAKVLGRAPTATANAALGLPATSSAFARGVKTATAAGAVAGAGFADVELDPEAPLSEASKEVIFGTAQSAALGATLGGVTGATLLPAGRLAGTIAKTVGRTITRNWPKAIQARIPGVGTSETHARELLWRALQEDGADLPTALRALTTLERSTQSAITIADLGGESVLALGRAAAGMRSPAAQQLTEALSGRQAEQGTRLMGGLVGRIFRDGKKGLGNSYATEEALLTARSAASKPLYTAAHQQLTAVTARMRQLLGNKTFRDAYKRGRTIADEEDLAGIANEGALKVPKLPEKVKVAGMGEATPEIEAALAAQGIRTFPEELPVRALDYMKRGLDEVIDAGFKRGGMTQRRAQVLRATLNEMLEEVDAAVPVYGEARTVFRGFSESMDAVRLGKDFLGKAPEVVRREMQRLRPQDRDFYRIGAAQSLYETVIRPNAETPNIAARYFGGKLFGRDNIDAQRLRALFVDAPEIAEDFMRQVAGETRLSHTTQRVAGGAPGGSSVQKLEQAGEGALPTLRMNVGLTVANIARSGVERFRSQWSQDVSNELAALFTRGLENPNEMRALLQTLASTGERIAGRTAGQRATIEVGKLAGRF